MASKVRVAIFVSGSGSNAENIFQYFQKNAHIEIVSFYCNNPNAFAIERAKRLNILCHIFDKSDFTENGKVARLLSDEKIDFIVLAGFLWLIPTFLINSFNQKIVNIHPALLPEFGGKGMYGMKVHQSVKNAQKKETGITIHLVNEQYDQGDIVFQAKTEIENSDTADQIAAKVQVLEYQYFPQIIESIILNIFKHKI